MNISFGIMNIIGEKLNNLDIENLNNILFEFTKTLTLINNLSDIMEYYAQNCSNNLETITLCEIIKDKFNTNINDLDNFIINKRIENNI